MGLNEKNDKIEFGYGCVKNDLIFWFIDIKGEAEYSWDFARNNEEQYKTMLKTNRNKKGNKITHGYPDHAILRARITV